MDRRSRFVLLAVLGTGVFLAGLELMVTAVALPSIVTDLASWTNLREASWVINGYLLAYVVTMPLAGRLADQWGVRRLFHAGLVTFTAGSFLAGLAPSLELLIAARLLQAVGGGILVPVGTAAASHLFEAHARPRALGVIGALTFLGMAAGPFVGAWIIGGLHPGAALDGAGLSDGPLRGALESPWRYVFYVNVPIGIGALALAWAAADGWETPRRAGRLDVAGAAAFSLALGLALLATTIAGSDRIGDLDIDPRQAVLGLAVAAAVAGVVAARRALRHPAPFLDLRLFRSPAFSSAALVSLLTGYGLATAIIGGAVFVDRVLYGGPDIQRVALGALAAATAVGALGSGFALRVAGLRLVTVAGLILSSVALVRMGDWKPETGLGEIAAWLAAFGLGFGLTVTPRSTAAVEALGHAAFGVASAVVTVARMVGMAIGLAALTAFGSTTIDRISHEVYATPGAYLQFIPERLRDRPLHDGQVVQALESWAAGEAARILVGIFLVAAAVTVVALLPALALRRRRILAEGAVPDEPAAAAERGGVA
ncbi:MAG TPA: MFS transporter [Candidatus Sulfomarinibacteraceae bacterium]|nr:MFS transporter [Candidatus Sulfomarinibacteraceae bacterium]